MHDKKLLHAVTLPSVLREEDVAEKVKLAIAHLHMPFSESLLLDMAPFFSSTVQEDRGT